MKTNIKIYYLPKHIPLKLLTDSSMNIYKETPLDKLKTFLFPIWILFIYIDQIQFLFWTGHLYMGDLVFCIAFLLDGVYFIIHNILLKKIIL